MHLSSFLALETFVRGNGIRMDIVGNLTVQDIWNARPVFVQCPYCREMVSYGDHQAHCKERETAISAGQDEVQMKPSKWRIQIRDHKTGNVSGIELVWSDKFFKIVKAWMSKNGLNKSKRPFKDQADWRKLSTVLEKLVPELFALTRGNLGLKDFRRLAIKKIFESGKDIELKLRTIGKSLL